MSVAVKKWVYLIVLSIIWGSSYILIKKGLVGLTPIQLGAFRILMTTVILLLVGYKSLRGWSFQQWKWLVFTGFFGTFFPSFLFAFSETEINSSVVAVLNGLTPLFTIIIAFFFFQQRVKKKQLGGVLVGFLGTVILVAQEFSLSSSIIRGNKGFRATIFSFTAFLLPGNVAINVDLRVPTIGLESKAKGVCFSPSLRSALIELVIEKIKLKLFVNVFCNIIFMIISDENYVLL